MNDSVNSLRHTRRTPSIRVSLMFAFALTLSLPVAAQGQWATNGWNINNTNGGNVGVGTASPDPNAKLHVAGSTDVAGTNVVADGNDRPTIQVEGNYPNLIIKGQGNANHSAALGLWSFDGVNTRQWNMGVGQNGIFSMGYVVNQGNPHAGLYNYGTPFLTMTPAGNIGFGTATPAHKLEVRGDGTGADWAGRLALSNSSGDRQVFLGTWNSNAVVGAHNFALNAWTPLYVNAVDARNGGNVIMSGNVGIGTTSPDAKLTVQGEGLLLNVGGAGNGSMNVRHVNGKHWANGGVEDLYLQYAQNFHTILNAGGSVGSVGIGTTTPQAKLHVAGDVVVDGNIAAKYQDVAEWVETSQQLAAGTVVVLDTERVNQVLASTESYDTKVAGVVSAQPGLLLGEAGADKVKVATTGRVRVRVDASKSPIKVGDLLVTSDEAGYAMRSEPLIISGRRMHSPGTLIGKALEPLQSGKGEILVLLSLQ